MTAVFRYLLMVAWLLASNQGVAWGQPETDEPGVLRGHLAPVLMGAFTPDGERAVTVSSDETVRLWDLKTGKEIRQYKGHTGPLYCMALSGDGRMLVTGAQDNTLRLWDVPQPRPVLLMAGHQGAAGGLAVSPDGRMVVSGGADKAVRLWMTDAVAKSVAGMKPQLALGSDYFLRAGHQGAVTAAAWRNDSAYFATADAEGRINVWSPFIDAAQGEIGRHTGGVTGLAFPTNNQQLVSAGGDGVIRFWQLPIPPQRDLTGITAAVTDVAIPTNQAAAVVSSADGTVRLFDVNTAKVTREFPRSDKPVTSVAVQPNNALVAMADNAGRVRLLNFADGADRGSVSGHEGAVNRVAFHPDNTRIATTGADGTVRLWTFPLAAVPANGHTGPVRAIAASQNGQWFVTGSDDKTVRVWASTGAAQRQMANHKQPVLAVDVRRDDAQIASGDAEGAVWLWNGASGAAEGSLLAHAGPVRSVAYEAANQTLLTGGDDGLIKRWQLPLVPPRLSNGHTQPVQTVAVSPDGSLMVTGSTDGTVRVWNASNGQAVRTLAGQTESVTAVAISADGTQVAAVGDAGQLLVWTLADGTLKHTRIGMAGVIHDVAFLPDGTGVATVDADQALRLWRLPEAAKEVASDGAPYQVAAVSQDGKLYAVGGQSGGKHAVIVRDRESGQVVATLVGHTAAVTAIAFDKGGNRLISGSADKTSRIWKLDGGAAELFKHEGYPGAVLGVALSDDATVAFSTGSENVIRQWTVADGAEVRSIAGHGGVVQGLIVRGAILISASDDGMVRQWNTGNGAAVRSMNHGGNLRCVAVSVDGSKIASGGTDKNAKIWNAANGAAIATLAGAATEITGVVFSDDESRVAVATADGVRVWGIDARPVERVVTPATTLQGVVWSADGTSLLACRTDGKVERHSVSVSQVLPLPDAGTTRVAVAPDGKSLFASGASKVVRVWAVTDGKVTNPAPVRTLTGPALAVTALSIGRDGMRLAAASEDKNAYVWDVTGGATAAIQKLVHAAALRSVSLSADSLRLATAGDGGATHLWDLQTGQLAEQLPGAAQAVKAVAISGDGKLIVNGGQDNSVRTFTPAVSGVFVAAAANAAIEPVTQVVALTGDAGFAALTNSGKQVLRWKLDGSSLPAVAAPVAGLKTLRASADGARLLATNAQGQGFVWTVVDSKLQATLAFGGTVTDAAFNKNGTEIAVVDQQARVRVFAVEPFRLLEEIAVPTPAHQIAWTGADGRQIATIGPQNSGAVAMKSLQRLWDGLSGGASAIAFSTNGQQAFAAGKDGKIRQWKTTDGVLERTLEGHTDAVTELTVAPNGQQLVSVSLDKTLRVWNLADGSLVRSVEHTVPVRGVSVRSDSLRAATVADDGQVRVWDLASGVLLQTFESHAVAGAAVRWLSDGVTLVSGASDKTLVTTKTSIIRAMAAHEKTITDIAMYAGGAQIVSCSPDGKVIMTDMNGGQLVRAFEGLTGEPKCVACRVDNQRLAAGTSDGKVLVWNPGNAQLLQTIEIGSPVTAVAYSPDNQKLAVVDASNTLRIFGPVIPPEVAQSGIELYLHQETVSAQPLPRIEFARDNRSVWATQADGQVSQWAYASPIQLRQFNHGGPVYGVAISRDGKTVISGSTDQTIRIWDATTGQQRFQMTGHVGAVHSVALSPDESLVVSSGADKSVRLWDLTGGRQLKQLATLTETMYSVAVHPNGQSVAAAGADRKVHLFDLLTGAEKLTMEGHTDYIHCVAFNSTGTRLLSYGYAGQLRVWNSADGKSLLEQRVGQIGNFADYAADGTRTLLSNGDGTARVFEIPAAAQ
jgi:WD40 repeat protein